MIRLMVLAFIVVHSLDGKRVEVNVAAISSIRAPRKDQDLITKEVNCIIGLTNGKSVTTVEPCGEITKMLNELGAQYVPH